MRFKSLWMLLVLVLVCASATPVMAEDDSFDFMSEIGRPALLSIVFTLIGLVFFAACIWLIVRFTPFSVQKEIEEDQNTALGIIIGSMILGIAIILAAAMIG